MTLSTDELTDLQIQLGIPQVVAVLEALAESTVGKMLCAEPGYYSTPTRFDKALKELCEVTRDARWRVKGDGNV